MKANFKVFLLLLILCIQSFTQVADAAPRGIFKNGLPNNKLLEALESSPEPTTTPIPTTFTTLPTCSKFTCRYRHVKSATKPSWKSADVKITQ